MHSLKNLIMCLCMLVFMTGCGRQEAVFITTGQEEPDITECTETVTESTGDVPAAQTELLIAVYVCGAVKNPGVYYLESSDIRDTAIQLAGGFSEEADDTYVNLAQKVTEGERIYVPTKDEVIQGIQMDTNTGDMTSEDAASGVNINTAGKEELMQLPGIGESKADAILAYREAHGKFRSTDELMNISGIKEGVYNKIKDLIVVN